MPSGTHWIHFFLLNLLVMCYIFIVFYLNKMAEIKENWPMYRCNPMYMMMADDITQNFQYCIQTTQSNYMGYLLQPLTNVTGAITDNVVSMSGDIQNIRAMFDKVRTFIADIVENIFGIFFNLVIEFQKITISIRDLMGKTIGIMTTLLYTMDGSMKTMNSTWNGPPGQIVRSLGKCFHPSSAVQLQTGEIKSIKDIQLNDVLLDGSIVEATMQIDNTREPVPIYLILDGGGAVGEANGVSVATLVTGSHMIWHSEENEWIPVSRYPKAIRTKIETPILYCLITNTHQLQVSPKVLLWDWEDYLFAHKK